jgi:hypothetical protein
LRLTEWLETIDSATARRVAVRTMAGLQSVIEAVVG